jgi:uncharacterized membrane protein YkoI
MTRFVWILLLSPILVGQPDVAGAAYARVCLDATQTRAAISEHKLANPVVAQRNAAIHVGGGEFLRSRLCRWNEDYIYEISLLLRDGHVTQVYIRAEDGRIVGKNGE